MSQTSLRVLYLAGSGDASQSLRAFAKGEFNSFIGHVGYSDQLFRTCDELGVELLALCSNPKAVDFSLRTLRVEQRPDPLAGKTGLSYYLAQFSLARQIITEARRFRANVVITAFEPLPFLLMPLRLSGVKLVQALHCVLWPEFRPRRPQWKVLEPILRGAYRRTVSAILSASHYVTRQVESLAKRDVCPIVEFLPTFRGEAYSSVEPPAHEQRPFRVMFVGRMEAYKGIHTLVDVALKLRQMGRTDIVFEICGDGAAFEGVKSRVNEAGLSSIFNLHGWCSAEELGKVSMRSHLYVVPTDSSFVEGFNHVVVESLLVGRPVITSMVCPAVDYVPESVYLVPPDSVEGYLNGIVELADNTELYRKLQGSCRASAARFLAPADGFGSAVREVLSAFQQGKTPQRHTIALGAPRAD